MILAIMVIMKIKLLLAFLAFTGVSNSLKAQAFFDDSRLNAYTATGAWTPRYLKPAPVDSRIDPSLIRASKLAEQHAAPRSILRCWHYVKAALVDAGAVRSCPTTAYAFQAADELVARHGFVKLRGNDPYSAPVGSVLVYSGHGAGHVELRTAHGFASDYRSIWACRFHLIGIYAKLVS